MPRRRKDSGLEHFFKFLVEMPSWTIGEFGGVICDTVEEAAEYVLEDPMGIFWR